MIRKASMVLALIIVSELTIAQAQTPSEYQLKAAIIYNFPKFVEWPARNDSHLPIIIGILGQDPFGKEIDDVISGKTANGRHLVIKRFSKIKDLSPCHILFVASSDKNNLRQIFAAVASAGVLTVGESDRFAEAGGVIQLNMTGGKVRLTINQAAAERANLRFSAKLLGLADVIRK